MCSSVQMFIVHILVITWFQGKDEVLCTFVSGSRVEKLRDMTDQQVVDACVQCLSKMFKVCALIYYCEIRKVLVISFHTVACY